MSTTSTILDSVALGVINLTNNAGNKGYGCNIVVGNNNSGVTAAEIAGIEIDLQGTGPVTFYEGMEIQAFNGVSANVGFRLTGNGSGNFGIGIDLSGGTYTSSALKIGNNQSLAFADTSGSHDASIVMSSANILSIFAGSDHATQFGDGGSLTSLYLNNPGNNYIEISPTTSGNSPFISAVGSDSVINLNLQAKGAAVNLISGSTTIMSVGDSVVQFASANQWSANGSTSVSLTSVAPSGAHATVQEWLTLVDNNGVTRYIPCF
jgi:hypothetical protein